MQINEIKTLQAVDGWVDFQGQITELKELKQRGKESKLMHKFKVRDVSGDITVWAYTNNNQPFKIKELVSGKGMLKEYQSVKYLDWTTIKGIGAPPQDQETPQQSRPAPKAPQVGQSDQEKTTRLSIERQTAWRGACDRWAGKDQDVINDDVLVKTAQAGAHFIATGELPVDHTESDRMAKELSEPPDEPREPGEDEPPEEQF